MNERLTPDACLPADRADALLVGRAWLPQVAAPVPVLVAGDDVVDLSAVAATTSQLFELPDPVGSIRAATGSPRVGALAAVLANSAPDARAADVPWLLAPCDLQAIKASGVTFVASTLERVIEEQARGDPAKAESVRAAIVAVIGDNLAGIRPGSPEAAAVKQVLIRQGAWSQYLEVGIGPDAEIFTKAQPMSAVGHGAEIGIHPKSEWNNPEPEIVLAVDSRGRTVGATLGNDVNLRDFEGRSALLLGKAKDNNASCAIGPFIRLFDERFGIDDVRQAELAMRVDGPDGFTLDGHSSMRLISRDPLDLVDARDRPEPPVSGRPRAVPRHDVRADARTGWRRGRVSPTSSATSSPCARRQLGALVNRVDHSDKIAPWTFGIAALMASLARRR